MSDDPSEPRQVDVPEHLWQLLQTMSREMGSSVSSLVSQAVFNLARINGYATPGAIAQEGSVEPPASSIPDPKEDVLLQSGDTSWDFGGGASEESEPSPTSDRDTIGVASGETELPDPEQAETAPTDAEPPEPTPSDEAEDSPAEGGAEDAQDEEPDVAAAPVDEVALRAAVAQRVQSIYEDVDRYTVPVLEGREAEDTGDAPPPEPLSQESTPPPDEAQLTPEESDAPEEPSSESESESEPASEFGAEEDWAGGDLPDATDPSWSIGDVLDSTEAATEQAAGEEDAPPPEAAAQDTEAFSPSPADDFEDEFARPPAGYGDDGDGDAESFAGFDVGPTEPDAEPEATSEAESPAQPEPEAAPEPETASEPEQEPAAKAEESEAPEPGAPAPDDEWSSGLADEWEENMASEDASAGASDDAMDDFDDFKEPSLEDEADDDDEEESSVPEAPAAAKPAASKSKAADELDELLAEIATLESKSKKPAKKAEPADADDKNPGRLSLQLRGGDQGAVEVGDETFIIGRGDDCDFVVKSPDVSRAHAEILRNGDGSYTLRDRDSRNGVWMMDGERVKTRTLQDGDVFLIGGRTIVARIRT